MRTSQVALLIYLTVSEHFLSVVALRTALGAESGGIKTVTGLIYSPPQRQKYRYREPKCPKPYNKGNRDGMCRFYKCDHMRNREKIESYKVYVLSTSTGFRENEFLKATAKYMHRAHKVALRGADLQCDWAKTIGDEFATWAEKQMPGAYGCIRRAMEIQAGKTQSKCKEGFTREFERRMRKECRDQLGPNLKTHQKQKKWARITVGVGAVVGASVLPVPLAGLGALGLAAVAIVLHVCKKYKVKSPKLNHRGMFAKKAITAEDVAQSDLSKLGNGDDDRLDTTLQEQEEQKDQDLRHQTEGQTPAPRSGAGQGGVGLDEMEKRIVEEDDEVDLLGLGDDTSGDDSIRPTSESDSADDSSTEAPWWEGMELEPHLSDADDLAPAQAPTPGPQSDADLLGDLLVPTPVDSSAPTQTLPPHYVDPMSLYDMPAPANPFFPQAYTAAPMGPIPQAYTAPTIMYGQPYVAQPANPFAQPPGGFTPVWDANSAPQQTPPVAPPVTKQIDDLFSDLKW